MRVPPRSHSPTTKLVWLFGRGGTTNTWTQGEVFREKGLFYLRIMEKERLKGGRKDKKGRKGVKVRMCRSVGSAQLACRHRAGRDSAEIVLLYSPMTTSSPADMHQDWPPSSSFWEQPCSPTIRGPKTVFSAAHSWEKPSNSLLLDSALI